MPKEEKLSWLEKQVERWNKMFIWGKIFVACVFIESVVLVAIQINVQARDIPRCANPPCKSQTDLFYSLSIYILVGFMDYYAYAGLRDDNMFEILAFLAVTILIFFYSILLVSQHASWHFEVYIFITTVMLFAYSFICYKIYLEIGWYIYKRIGANQELREIYRSAQLFLAMIKFDLLFSLLLVILAGLYYLQPSSIEFYLTIFAFILTFIWAVLGWKAVSTENEVFMNVYLSLAIFEPVFIIYKLLKLSSTVPGLPVTLFILATVAECLIRSGLVITAVIAKHNFGKGLITEAWGKGISKVKPLVPIPDILNAV